MSNIILLAETGADIPENIAGHFGIEIVPMHVNFGDQSLPDGSFPVEKVYEYYQTTHTLPKTSGCTPEDFTAVFDRIHEQHPDAQILHLAYSAVTTCSFQSAEIAAEGRGYVVSIDTKMVSAGQGAVVARAAQLLQNQPELSMESLISAVKGFMKQVRMCFLPGDLQYLKAGGRVSNAQYLGAQLLKLHPMIEILDGKLIATKKYRGQMAKIAAKLTQDYIEAQQLARDSICFLHSSKIDEAIQESAEGVAYANGFEKVVWQQTGCVVSTHCGPGAFGIVGFAQ